MPPQSRTTRAQTKKRPPQTTKTARKATQAVPKATQVAPKARTRRPQVAPEAAPAPAQDAPASAPSNAPRILPAEASPAFDQSLPESTSSGPTERQAPDIEEVHFTAPDGTHEVSLSPPLQEMAVAWPSIQRMLAWWQERERALQEPTGPLERVTYHVRPALIEAVRREADLTGETLAAIVNRALEQYFAARST